MILIFDEVRFEKKSLSPSLSSLVHHILFSHNHRKLAAAERVAEVLLRGLLKLLSDRGAFIIYILRVCTIVYSYTARNRLKISGICTVLNDEE